MNKFCIILLIFIEKFACSQIIDYSNCMTGVIYKHTYVGSIGEYPIKMTITADQQIQAVPRYAYYSGEYSYTRVGGSLKLDFKQKLHFEIDCPISCGMCDDSLRLYCPDIINQGLRTTNYGYTIIEEKNAHNLMTGLFLIWDFINAIESRSNMTGKWYSPDGIRTYPVHLIHIETLEGPCY